MIIPKALVAKENVPLINHFQEIAKTAAKKCKVLQLGIETIKNMINHQKQLVREFESSQSVFIEEKVVFKKCSPKAYEEERNIDSLFEFLFKDNDVVPSCKIRNPQLSCYGIALKESKRGFSPGEMSAELLKTIYPLLSKEDRSILKSYLTSPDYTQLAKYRILQSQVIRVRLTKRNGRKEDQNFTFNDFKKNFLAEKIPLNASFETLEHDTLIPMLDHYKNNTPLIQALNYFPAIQDPQLIYLVPDLTDCAVKAAYEKCENVNWKYLDLSDHEHTVDFKKLFSLILLKKVKSIWSIPNKKNPSPTPDEFILATQVKWKTYETKLKVNVGNHQSCEIKDFLVKPLVKMFRFDVLSDKSREKILSQLRPESEVSAVLTSINQYLDLHHENIGFEPVGNEEYEYFKNIEFIHRNEIINFDQFMMKYFDGEISKHSIIRYRSKGRIVKKKLSKSPKLLRALEVKWKLVLFDGDTSLSESNTLMALIRQKNKGHLIPLRSILLATDWKNKPLSDVAVKNLMALEDGHLKEWVAKSDSTVYRRLSQKTKLLLSDQLKPILKVFHLSGYRKHDFLMTIERLGDLFADEISKIDNVKYLEIWKLIESDLSLVNVLPNQTWKSIALRYKQDVNTLKKLNPETHPQHFQNGQKIKIEIDLTTDTLQAHLERIKIAKQLFPRLTYYQQKAFIEREENMKNYLLDYEQLQTTYLKGVELADYLKKYIQSIATPLNSRRKDALMIQLNELEENDPDDIKNILLEECQPTYFNATKAMYPLLANAYDLIVSVNKYEASLEGKVFSENKEGRLIGRYDTPLELYINKAFEFFDEHEPLYQVAQHLKNTIEAKSGIAFLGNVK